MVKFLKSKRRRDMLQLKNIVKDYVIGDLKQQVLKGVSINFRPNEFVSILGPSGSGKTTLLNIIGGLDQYTTGDLMINGVSTQKYKDSDWDLYRNKSIGFVFQSYNLIPHQTVLSNVELSLTLAGISKAERRKRAVEVLTKVGLADHLHKKPNQMSGGQMQRVAIARALINNPEILLADEPTGALDTETSVQIMDLLKEIAREKLVIMVTHNPELAEQYSTRIIRLLDGKIKDDTRPLEVVNEDNRVKKDKIKHISMSFLTALSLSFNNLKTKKGRTILTAFAGSIGIIGIAMILSLSSGMRDYINQVQEDTLSSYPITIASQGVDLLSTREQHIDTLLNMNGEQEHEKDKVYQGGYVSDILQLSSITLSDNNLSKFKDFLDGKDGATIRENTNAIQYGYGLDLQIYQSDVSEGVTQINPSPLLEMNQSPMPMMDEEIGNAMGMSSNNIWTEMIDNEDLIKGQYNLVAGNWPQKFNEVLLVVDEENEISDMALYALGLKDKEEFNEIQSAIEDNEEIDYDKYPKQSYTYEDILDKEFSLVLNSDYYEKVDDTWVDRKNDENYVATLIEEKSTPIHVVGIIRPNEEAAATTISGTIAYRSDLIQYVIDEINNSEIVKEQKENKEINIFTNQPFVTNEITNQEELMAQLTDEQKAMLASLSETDRVNYLNAYAQNLSATYEGNLELLGARDMNKPASISLYLKDFNSRDAVTESIEKYNEDQKNAGNDENTIEYTDMVGVMISSMTSVIDMITYLLIGFVSISLVVSSIMIGIITYISVLERTKEIGILRSIGASKRDISRVFNAETVIVGFAAGMIGIGVTYLLNIPINWIIGDLSGVNNLAQLPLGGAIVLVLISVVLTMIAGLIPSRLASKKDPVIALRTE